MRATDEHEVADIELALSRQLYAAGRYEEAITHASAAIEAYAGSDDLVAKASADCALADALAVGRGEHERALRLVGPQLEALNGRLDVFPLLGRLSARQVRSRLLLGLDYRDAADNAVRLATRSGEPGLIADSYISLALHYFNNGANGLGRVLLESAEPLAREAHDTRTFPDPQNLQAYGNPEDAEPLTTWARGPWPPPASAEMRAPTSTPPPTTPSPPGSSGVGTRPSPFSRRCIPATATSHGSTSSGATSSWPGGKRGRRTTDSDFSLTTCRSGR